MARFVGHRVRIPSGRRKAVSSRLNLGIRRAVNSADASGDAASPPGAGTDIWMSWMDLPGELRVAVQIVSPYRCTSTTRHGNR
jgi:hypothetical protein